MVKYKDKFPWGTTNLRAIHGPTEKLISILAHLEILEKDSLSVENAPTDHLALYPVSNQ